MDPQYMTYGSHDCKCHLAVLCTPQSTETWNHYGISTPKWAVTNHRSAYTSDTAMLQQNTYERFPTNRCSRHKRLAVATAKRLVFRLGWSQRPPVARNGSKYVKQSAADSRQGIITELRGRPEDCLRHCACYKMQNWQDFGKTKATDMGDGIGTMDRQISMQNRCIKNTSKIIIKIKLTFSNSTGDHVGQGWHWASGTLHFCKWHSYEKIKFGECLLQHNLQYLSSRLISKNWRIKIYETATLLGVSDGFQINMNVSYPKGTKKIEGI